MQVKGTEPREHIARACACQIFFQLYLLLFILAHILLILPLLHLAYLVNSFDITLVLYCSIIDIVDIALALYCGCDKTKKTIFSTSTLSKKES